MNPAIDPTSKTGALPASFNAEVVVSVSAILPADFAQIEPFVRGMLSTLAAHYSYYELLLVDNGLAVDVNLQVQMLQSALSNVRLVRLSRHYSREVAIAAALDHCIGDYVVVMDPASDPPEFVPSMLARAAQGCDTVVAEPANRRTGKLQHWISAPVYRMASRILGFRLRPDESYFRVFSRRLVNSIIRIRSKSRYLTCLNGSIGLQQCTLLYDRAQYPELPGAVSPHPVRELIRELIAASDILVSNSATPLRFASLLGLLASAGNLVYLFYIFAVSLVKAQIAEGWLTTSLTHTVMFLLLFLIMSILSEYIARILDETKDQPLYFVESESNSTISAAAAHERLNVV